MLGIPSIALSLDNYRGPPDYSVASSLSVCLVRALLSSPESLSCLRGSVLNVNFPLRSMEDTKVRGLKPIDRGHQGARRRLVTRSCH